MSEREIDQAVIRSSHAQTNSRGPCAMHAEATTGASFRDIRFTTRDGLRLYARHYPARHRTNRRPVMCLAGLTRNSRDFHEVALALSQHPDMPRNVYTLDTRGRGFSDYDRDWRNYAVPVEMHDALDFMVRTELFNAAVIGTSRGGLIAMVMAAVQPSAIGAVVLNDIGPVVEIDGLLRIAGYVGRTPPPTSWKHAGEITAEINQRQFPKVTPERWKEISRQFFNEKNGRPIPSYDPKVARSLSVLNGPMPALWPQFDALKRVPVMVIRGANSDLLSQATVEAMSARHPALSVHVVPDEGHAPLLHDAPTIDAITAFLGTTDETYAAAA